MIAYLKKRHAREQFHPGWLGMLVNPFYLARQGFLDAIRSHAPAMRGSMLDIGCGQKPYRHLFEVSNYVGLEYDTPGNRERKRADFFMTARVFHSRTTNSTLPFAARCWSMSLRLMRFWPRLRACSNRVHCFC